MKITEAYFYQGEKEKIQKDSSVNSPKTEREEYPSQKVKQEEKESYSKNVDGDSYTKAEGNFKKGIYSVEMGRDGKKKIEFEKRELQGKETKEEKINPEYKEKENDIKEGGNKKGEETEETTMDTSEIEARIKSLEQQKKAMEQKLAQLRKKNDSKEEGKDTEQEKLQNKIDSLEQEIQKMKSPEYQKEHAHVTTKKN